MDTNQLVTPLFTLAGTFLGGAIAYYTEKQRRAYEERSRLLNERKLIYSQAAFSLLRRYSSEAIDDVFLQNMIDISLLDDRDDSISKALIVLKDNRMWNEQLKYNLVVDNIIPGMRKRLKELSQESVKAKSWWQFWK